MKVRILILTVTIFFAALGFSARLRAQLEEGQQCPSHYRVVNLGTLGGSSSFGNTINNLGWAMGSANLAGNTTEHATLWVYGLKLDLGTLGGPNSDVIFPNRNDRGEIVGIAETSAMDPLGEAWSCGLAFFPTVTGHICLGFAWKPVSYAQGHLNGMMTALPTLGGNNGVAAAVNNQGQVVGWAENTVHDPTCIAPQVLQFEAVIWGPSAGQIQQLPPLSGDPDTAATAINDKGQVVGISGTCDNAVGAYSAKHAVLWENGTAINIGSLGGAGWNTPIAINNRGQIAGFSDLPGDVSDGLLTPNFHAFLWTKEGGMQDLGTLPGDSISEATGINDQGQIVGVSFPSSHAFLWHHGLMTDLNTLIPSDSPLYLISTGDINDGGEITGQACVASDGVCTSETPAFLAIPMRDGDTEDALSAAQAGGTQGPKVVVPESIRKQVLNGLASVALGPSR
jgi:probable HAF family extracellular repeat protein